MVSIYISIRRARAGRAVIGSARCISADSGEVRAHSRDTGRVVGTEPGRPTSFARGEGAEVRASTGHVGVRRCHCSGDLGLASRGATNICNTLAERTGFNLGQALVFGIS